MNKQLLDSPLIGTDVVSSFLTPTKSFRWLAILLALFKQEDISQHRLAQATGLSSAMVNAYVRELGRQGMISRLNRNNRDMCYRLTAKGRTELLRLFSSYAAEVVQLYTQAKNEISRQLKRVLTPGVSRRLVLYGASETCELTLQALEGFPQARIAGVVDSDPAKHGTDFHGHTIMPPERIRELEAELVIITSFARQDEIYETISHLEQEGITIKKLAEV